MTTSPVIAITAATRTRALAGIVLVERAGDMASYVLIARSTTADPRWSLS